MAATPDHGSLDQNLQGIHVPFQFKFPDEASRTGAPASRLTGGASKFAYQEDTSALWFLAETEPTPTWASMAAGITGTDLGVVSEGANLGSSGYAVFSEKSGASLLFKTLVAGTNVTLGSAASTVTINSAAGGGDISEGANIGTGFEVFSERSGASLLFKTLVGGTNITLSSAASTVTITGGTSSASVSHFSATIGASSNWNNELIPLWQAPKDGSATILEILSTTSGTNTPTLSFNLQHRDWNAMSTAGIDIFAASQTATSAGEQAVAFARSTVDPRAHLMFTTGSGAEGGSVNYLQMTVYYSI